MDNELKTARIYLDKWRGQLASKNRGHQSLSDNFLELWHDLWKTGVSYDTATNVLDSAVKAHLPSHEIAKATFQRSTHGKTYAQFMEDWEVLIKAKAIQALFDVYGEPETGETFVKIEKIETEPHVLAMRRLSIPLTAEKYKEILSNNKLLLEDDYDQANT